MDFFSALTSTPLSVFGTVLGGLVTMVVAFLGVRRAVLGRAGKESRTEAAEEAEARRDSQIVQQVEQVRETHDRLESDPAYSSGVRDRFTRPD